MSPSGVSFGAAHCCLPPCAPACHQVAGPYGVLRPAAAPRRRRLALRRLPPARPRGAAALRAVPAHWRRNEADARRALVPPAVRNMGARGRGRRPCAVSHPHWLCHPRWAGLPAVMGPIAGAARSGPSRHLMAHLVSLGVTWCRLVSLGVEPGGDERRLRPGQPNPPASPRATTPNPHPAPQHGTGARHRQAAASAAVAALQRVQAALRRAHPGGCWRDGGWADVASHRNTCVAFV